MRTKHTQWFHNVWRCAELTQFYSQIRRIFTDNQNLRNEDVDEVEEVMRVNNAWITHSWIIAIDFKGICFIDRIIPIVLCSNNFYAKITS